MKRIYEKPVAEATLFNCENIMFLSGGVSGYGDECSLNDILLS